MIQIIFSLFVIYELSFVYAVTGPNGQDCTPGDDDNPPDACAQQAPFTSLEGTVIECEENFDCCTCVSITCGTAVAGPFCEKFVANGDSSAFGVKPIIINGDPDDGTPVECTGDLSCKETVFGGSGIKEVKCGGDESCYESIWDIDCLPDEPCHIECVGDDACSLAVFDVEYSNGLKCADEACRGGAFSLETNVGGKVECDGELACSESDIVVTDIESFGCGGEGSCRDALIGIIAPQDDFKLECDEVEGCRGATITISIPADSTVTELEAINCGEDHACKDTKIMITNNSPNTVTIEELNCEGAGACDGLEVELTGDIVFDECKCGKEGGCIGATGIPSPCFENVEALECKETVCSWRTINIVNPEEDFELICEEGEEDQIVGTCEGLQLNIEINDNAKDAPIEQLKGVKCEVDGSCLGMTVTIDNKQTGGVIVNVEEIKCDGDAGTSCALATFSGNGQNNVVFDKIECNGNCGVEGEATQCLAEDQGVFVFCGDSRFAD